MPRAQLHWGDATGEVDIPEEKAVRVRREPLPPAIKDVATAVRRTLEQPLNFPPLRRALTPDDHLAVVVDEGVNRLPELLTPVLEELLAAGVDLQRVTLLCPPRVEGVEPDWPSRLPGLFKTVTVEVHDPRDRRRLSYLAMTKAERRVYLNRTLVDADQIVVVSRVRYDPILGYGGGLADLFPALSDEATRQETAGKPSEKTPGGRPWPVRQEANEVGWLLGMPFVIELVEDALGGVLAVNAGLGEPVATESRKTLDAAWRVEVETAAELVLGTVNSTRPLLADVARAFANAARVVATGGKIVVLCNAGPEMGSLGEILQNAENIVEALAVARAQNAPEALSIWQWAVACKQAQLYLLSRIAHDAVEEMFVTPLDKAEQTQRLIDQAETCIVLPDADRVIAVTASASKGRR